ncbi:MAG: fibronectin type III domain-containing protein [Actinobacteria bacterium]|nr:fibronectin type III domain-containing protein [Actinomycetota bacterium]
MSAMRNLALRVIALSLLASPLTPATSPALTFNSAPANNWGYVLGTNGSTSLKQAPRIANLEGEAKSEWKVNYKNFPENARLAVQQAIDIWSRNFESKVVITVDAVWETNKNNKVLGAARAGYYFNSFLGAPDEDLWYPSVLANVLAEKDLNPNQSEIILSINSTPNWYFGIDGRPTPNTYDLVSVVLHEVAHGLGFMSNAQYDRFMGTAFISQPTPFDAYVQLPDGKTFNNFCSRSTDLGRAMINPLVWSGEFGISANNGVKPKLYTPAPFEEGSSIAHLDERTFDSRNPNTMMTPNMDQGEVFPGPGPIALAMIQDMLRKPPAIVASDIPAKPLNVRAVIGDKYAIITLDSPECRRIDRVQNYKITISPSGETRTFKNTPYRITGLKNGTNYTFSITAENSVGTSEPVTTNTIKPQSAPALIEVDRISKVTHLASTTFRGKAVILYNDTGLNKLKMAIRSGDKWRISTVRRGLQIGQLSICKSGAGAKEKMYVFYGEFTRKDLVLSTFDGKKWDNQTVDGNGESIQDYKEVERRRTASDVSVSNGCVITKDGIQVFYRDESQGILLGAVDKGKGWEYEIVDGDLDTNGRTTGDVAFNLAVTTFEDSVYLLYDSVLTINSNDIVTSGEIRLAVRDSADVKDWIYETLDGPKSGNAIAGFATAISASKSLVSAAWLSARTNPLNNPTILNVANVTDGGSISTLTAPEFGVMDAPIRFDGAQVSYSCGKRLCSTNLSQVKLLSANPPLTDSGNVISFDKKKYLPVTIDEKLVLVRR